MTWIAPSEKDTDNAALEKRLGDAADQFRANSGLKSQEYFLAPWERVAAPAFSGPVQGSPTGRGEFAMSEGQGGRVKSELRSLKSELGVSGPFDIRHSTFGLCRNWTGLRTRRTNLWPLPLRPRKPREATRVRSPNDEFPMTNGTPIQNSTIEARTSNFPRFAIRNSSFGLPQVRQSKFVIRHCPDPHDATGRFDFVLANPPFNVNAVDDANCEVRSPSCEVQSIRHSSFVIRNFPRLSIHGVEKTDETGRLCRLVAVRKDLAVHGLEGEIKHGGNINSYYDDLHNQVSVHYPSNN